ncbi:glycerol-3-phosphate dehydrogenase/oxidase [Rhodococcus sp. X156]|uniref:glycerol-3-phosphate dehydrogenase/oxidase n=1 Tax=Rhodococcus sp. X156 TaxID=2499145 RepID=UPI000FDADBE4|nr:glycerol-3-phosphate dehydrogenase/oxidase [Rhodococcus sp. X156]
MSGPQPGTWLNSRRRSAELAQLADGAEVDLLVVGGGVTGAGVALDAASRGLSVALVEKADLAHGTSRWSSKLVHGGLRYLVKGDVALAWESARERHVLMEHTAPHLTRALPFLTPLDEHTPPLPGVVSLLGMRIGDGLRRVAGTSAHTLPAPRRVSSTEALQLVPGLRPAGLRGGLVHWDGQLADDARLVIGLARTAAGFGARVLTYAQALQVHADGARVRDVRTGAELDLRARAVVNATGVWADRLAPEVRLRPSKGVHLVVPAERLGRPSAALTVGVPGHFGRYVFALPQPEGVVYVGLTDDPAEEVSEEPQAAERDVDFLLEVVNAALRTPLTRADVVATYTGLRPLLDTGDASTADLSRQHSVLEQPPGVVTVVGGKLTTYRAMAQDAVDHAVALRGLDAGPCVTAKLGLVGALPRAELLGVDAPARLVHRYGAEAPVVRSVVERPGERVVPGHPLCREELLFGALAEGALDVGDLLSRRSRLTTVAPALVPTAAEVAKQVLTEASKALGE